MGFRKATTFWYIGLMAVNRVDLTRMNLLMALTNIHI